MDPNFSSQTGAGPSNSLLMSDPCHTVFPIDFNQPHIHTDFVAVNHEIEVIKRRPGRPKGSGKKSLGADSPLPKVKRPVGRPRKDGFPAGSVSSRPSVRSRRDVPTTVCVDTSVPQACSAGPSCVPPAEQIQFQFTAGAQSPWQDALTTTLPSYQNESSMPSTEDANFHLVYQHIDPNRDCDDWADLTQLDPSSFLATLVSSLHALNPVPSSGQSVEDAFKTHLVSLAPKNDKGKRLQQIPTLYSILKTFWLPCSPAYFSSTTSSSLSRSRSEHRFLYWDPQPLVLDGLACPSCSVPLANNGLIRSGPIKVYDLENPFFIIGCEYECNNCSPEGGRKFSSTDSSILKSLPAELMAEFPALLIQDDAGTGSGPMIWNWQGRGVSRSLWKMVKGCLRAGLGRNAILQVIQAIQSNESNDHQRMEDGEVPPMLVNGNSDAMQNILSAGRQFNEPSGDSCGSTWSATSAPRNPSPPVPVAAAAEMGVVPNQDPETLGPQYSFQQGGVPSIPFGYHTFLPITSSHSDPPSTVGALTFSGDLGGNQDVVILEPSHKRTRHCCKCGSQECKGKGGRSFCMNACKDCGKLECKGRNSRRPEKRCDEAWAR